MAKGVVFVVVFSVMTVILFCLFSYLITTVDPPPLNTDGKNESRRVMDLDSKTMFLDDELVILGNPQYGLEKVKTEYAFPFQINYLSPTNRNDEKYIRNKADTTWLPEQLITSRNSSKVFHTSVKAFTGTVQIFSMKTYKRSVSDALGKVNDLRSVIFKVFDGYEESKIKLELPSNDSII